MNPFSRFIHFNQAFLFSYEGAAGGVPDPAGGGGAGPAAPGTAPAPPAPGQGQPPQQAQGGAGARQYFPNVTDEAWAVMEPHVGQMEARMTQLQQQIAPFRAITDAGYTPETVQGLVNFDRRFNAAPLDVWLELGDLLQKQQGPNGRSVLDPDIDLEHLAALARGENPPEPGAPAPGTQPGAGAQPGQGDPALLARIDQLEGMLRQQQETYQRDQTQRQTSQSDQLFNRRLDQMKTALKQAGWPEEMVTPEDPAQDEEFTRYLTASVVTHRGDFAKAAKALIDQRTRMLQGFVQGRETKPKPTTLPNGAPESPSRERPGRNADDAFKKGTRNAEARLKRMNQPG